MASLSVARTRLQVRRSDKSYPASVLTGMLNQVLADIVSRKRWSWLLDDFNARTVARLSITSVSCTLGSRLIVLGAAATATLQGKRVLINGRTYRVLDTTTSAGMIFLLDQPFIDATTTYTVTVLYDEIALPPGATGVLSIGCQNSGGQQPYPLTFVPGTEGRMLDFASTGQPWSYTVLSRPQLPSPTAAPTAAMSLSGTGPGTGLTLTYWISYVDVQTQAESPLSPALSFTTTNTNTVTVTFGPKRGFHTRVFRSRNGGSVPYFLSEVLSDTTTTATDSSPDVYLMRRAPASGSSILVKLYPVPDAAYQIVGTISLECPSLDADNDSPPWPASYDALWLDGAEAMMLEASDEQGRAQQARQRYEAGIARMIRDDSPAPSAMIRIGGNTRLSGKPTMWWGALGS